MNVPLTTLLLIIQICLVSLAGWKWQTRLRREFPGWRNGLCFASLFLLSINLAVELASFLLLLLDSRSKMIDDLFLFSDVLGRPLATTAVVLALSLKRETRLAAAVAGLLMFLGLPLAYV